MALWSWGSVETLTTVPAGAGKPGAGLAGADSAREASSANARKTSARRADVITKTLLAGRFMELQTDCHDATTTHFS